MPTSPNAIPSIHVRVAVGAFLVMVANAIPLSVLSIFTPFITRELVFDTGSFQIYYSLVAVATAIGMPLSGHLMKKVGAQKLLWTGGIIACLGLVGLSMSTTLWHFYLSGLILGVGVGLGCMFVPVVLVNIWFVERRGMVLGLVLAGTGVGGAVLSFIVPLIIGDGTGWRPAFLVLAGVMATFTILPAALFIRNTPASVGLLPYGGLPAPVDASQGADEPGLTFPRALRSPWFYLFYAIIVLLGIIIAIVQSLAVHLDLLGLSRYIGPLMMIVTLGLVFWKIVLGTLIDVIGLRWAMIITLGLCAVCFWFMPGTTTFWLLVLFMIGISAGTANGTVVPPLAGAVAFGPREFAAIWGVGATAFSVGTAAGTPLWGWVKDTTGNFDIAFRLLPVLIAVTVLGLLLSMNRGQASYTANLKTPGYPDGKDQAGVHRHGNSAVGLGQGHHRRRRSRLPVLPRPHRIIGTRF